MNPRAGGGGVPTGGQGTKSICQAPSLCRQVGGEYRPLPPAQPGQACPTPVVAPLATLRRESGPGRRRQAVGCHDAPDRCPDARALHLEKRPLPRAGTAPGRPAPRRHRHRPLGAGAALAADGPVQSSLGANAHLVKALYARRVAHRLSPGEAPRVTAAARQQQPPGLYSAEPPAPNSPRQFVCRAHAGPHAQTGLRPDQAHSGSSRQAVDGCQGPCRHPGRFRSLSLHTYAGDGHGGRPQASWPSR
jgi:hypothetical protein